jgi:hypothetical protein
MKLRSVLFTFIIIKILVQLRNVTELLNLFNGRIKQNFMVQWFAFLLSTEEVQGSDLGPYASYLD